MYTLKTPEFNSVNRSQYGRGIDFKQHIVESSGNKSYFPTSGNCFIKCINHLTGKDYTDELLIFIRTEQRRSNVMTSARIQPFCIKYNINIGYYDGLRICPGNITERHVAIKIHKDHFCLIWKTIVIIFNKAIEDLKNIFKVDDNVIPDKRVKSFIKNECKPKKFY